MSSEKYSSAIEKLEVRRILNKIMRLHNLTQGGLAVRLGISQAYVSELLAGKKFASARVQKLINKEFPFVDAPVVDDSPEPYHAPLDREAQKIYREVERFLKTATRQKKEHLLRELRWLREHEEGKKK